MAKFPPLRISVFLPRQMFKQIKYWSGAQCLYRVRSQCGRKEQLPGRAEGADQRSSELGLKIRHCRRGKGIWAAFLKSLISDQGPPNFSTPQSLSDHPNSFCLEVQSQAEPGSSVQEIDLLAPLLTCPSGHPHASVHSPFAPIRYSGDFLSSWRPGSFGAQGAWWA